MIKKIFLTAACLLSASFLFCQEPCEEAFQLARDDYYAGRLNEVVGGLDLMALTVDDDIENHALLPVMFLRWSRVYRGGP